MFHKGVRCSYLLLGRLEIASLGRQLLNPAGKILLKQLGFNKAGMCKSNSMLINWDQVQSIYDSTLFARYEIVLNGELMGSRHGVQRKVDCSRHEVGKNQLLTRESASNGHKTMRAG
jgi:hypothetical protein